MFSKFIIGKENTKKLQLIEEMGMQLSLLTNRLTSIEEENRTLIERINSMENDLQPVKEREIKKSDASPWADLLCSEIDLETGRIRLQLDWNDMFIQQLRKQGFKGTSESELMISYLDFVADTAKKNMIVKDEK